MAHRRVLALLAVVLVACGSDDPPVYRPAAVTPAVIIEATTTTVAPTTTTTEPEPEPAPVTAPPAPRATTAPTAAPRATPVPAAPTASIGSGACGGDLPPCYVMAAESGGDPDAVNETGCGGRGCYGKWQFDPLTSRSLGYDRPMNEYPEHVQDEAARELMARNGCGQWSTC